MLCWPHTPHCCKSHATAQIITCDPLINKMNRPDLTASNILESSICCKYIILVSIFLTDGSDHAISVLYKVYKDTL